jgi:hypothetical protein
MRYAFCLLLFISFHLKADAINTEMLFSDSYQGYAYNQRDIYWYQEASYKVLSYKAPGLDSVSVEVELNPICVEGGSGDCAMGVLYKKLSEDAKGNTFYLVTNKNQQDVWVHSNEWETRDFDKRMIENNGMDLVFSDSFEMTDTSIQDGVPNLENERKEQIEKILRSFSPQLGDIKIELPADTKTLRVKDSHLKPEGKFLDYPLSKDSYYFQENTNRYVIETTVFKRQGNYMLVRLNSIPGLTVRDYQCTGDDWNYVWLDAKGLQVESSEADLQYPPIERLLEEFGRSYSVKEVKLFNGNSYALIQERLSVLNPFVAPDDDRVKRDDYTIPYKWIKIRDNKGRLRFWFASYSC